MSAEYLREATTAYLGRYMPSVFQLKQVLWRKIDKNIRMRGAGNRADYAEMIQAELEYRKQTGALDDLRFAEAWVESLHKKGKSRLQIKVKLQQKGIESAIIQQSLEMLEDDVLDYALEAAIQYARKRRFGPFQMDVQKRENRRQKDIAAMMRAGHAYDSIRKIMACQTLDEIELLYQDLGFE